MKQKKLVLLAGVMLVIIAIIVGGWIATNRQNDATKTDNNTGQNSSTNEGRPNTGKQICPDAWYDNQMPGPAEDAGRPSQYFIVNGQRAELNELDVAWVKANCAVNEPQVVQ